MPERPQLQRDVLPIPDITPVGLTTYDAKDPDTAFPPIEELRPPEGAPNVLIVLIDDVGFGASSAFGGPVDTPNAERLASKGLKYNRFHTTALCSPTRAALLSGRNHHSVGMGAITELATSAPGYNSIRPNTCAPLAETLKLNGYSTAQFGKCHEVPVWETSPMGPFHNWPTGSGFEYFYGFIGGEAHQYYPAIYEGTIPVEPEKTPEEGYHFMSDMTDKAIKWVRQFAAACRATRKHSPASVAPSSAGSSRHRSIRQARPEQRSRRCDRDSRARRSASSRASLSGPTGGLTSTSVSSRTLYRIRVGRNVRRAKLELLARELDVPFDDVAYMPPQPTDVDEEYAAAVQRWATAEWAREQNAKILAGEPPTMLALCELSLPNDGGSYRGLLQHLSPENVQEWRSAHPERWPEPSPSAARRAARARLWRHRAARGTT